MEEILLNDKLRFEKIITIFPEDKIDRFCNDYLFNAFYPVKFGDYLIKYKEYSKNTLSEFENSRINNAYKKLNEKFKNINDFINFNFDIPNQHFVAYKNPEYFYLEPRIHHNFNQNLTEQESAQWDKDKQELDNLTDKFYKAYKNFVKIGKNKIEKQDRKSKFWKTLKNIGIVIGILASIATIIIFISNFI